MDPANGPDSYIVTIELWDDDEPLQVESFVQTISVQNQVPQNVTATADIVDLDEGDGVRLSGSFTDAGALDSHLVRIIWGDQSPDTILSLPAGVDSFSGVAHTYVNNPSGTPVFSVEVQVSDYDSPGAFGSFTLPIEVENVRPSLGNVTFVGRNRKHCRRRHAVRYRQLLRCIACGYSHRDGQLG